MQQKKSKPDLEIRDFAIQVFLPEKGLVLGYHMDIYMCRIYDLEMQAVQVLQYDVKHSPFNRLLFGDENNQNVKTSK